MKTKQADKIIAKGEVVTVYNAVYGETFVALFVRRDRFNLYTSDGASYDRGELEIAGF